MKAWSEKLKEGGVVRLGESTLLLFTGPDRVRYLNGQLTQDVEKVLEEEKAVQACVTNHKGQMEAWVTLCQSADGEGLWVSAPPALRESLAVRLERYIIADDVSCQDLSDSFTLFHAWGKGMDLSLSDAPASLSVKIDRYGFPGWDFLVENKNEEVFIEWAKKRGANRLTEEEVQAIRIERQIPEWGRELTEGLLPPEALLEERAISYDKGCYIGQEVISRMKRAGKVNRRLSGFEIQNFNDPDLPGEGDIRDPESDKVVGKVTSGKWIPELECFLALGYLKPDCHALGKILKVTFEEVEDGTALQALVREPLTL